jgi:hypothetical protein
MKIDQLSSVLDNSLADSASSPRHAAENHGHPLYRMPTPNLNAAQGKRRLVFGLMQPMAQVSSSK